MTFLRKKKVQNLGLQNDKGRGQNFLLSSGKNGS